MAETARQYIRVSGRVQGVGFRYFTRQLAQKHRLVGFVRNMPNGDVEMEAEGDMAHLQAFIAGVQKGPSAAWVRDSVVSDLPLRKTEDTFEIRMF